MNYLKSNGEGGTDNSRRLRDPVYVNKSDIRLLAQDIQERFPGVSVSDIEKRIGIPYRRLENVIATVTDNHTLEQAELAQLQDLARRAKEGEAIFDRSGYLDRGAARQYIEWLRSTFGNVLSLDRINNLTSIPFSRLKIIFENPGPEGALSIIHEKEVDALADLGRRLLADAIQLPKVVTIDKELFRGVVFILQQRSRLNLTQIAQRLEMRRDRLAGIYSLRMHPRNLSLAEFDRFKALCTAFGLDADTTIADKPSWGSFTSGIVKN